MSEPFVIKMPQLSDTMTEGVIAAWLKKVGDKVKSGDILAEVMEAEGEREKQVEEERGRFLRAPVVIGVISSARELHKIPVWEQELSAGAVCQNILIAATALGFVANWLTEWYAFHPVVKEKLGLKPGDSVAPRRSMSRSAVPPMGRSDTSTMVSSSTTPTRPWKSPVLVKSRPSCVARTLTTLTPSHCPSSQAVWGLRKWT